LSAPLALDQLKATVPLASTEELRLEGCEHPCDVANGLIPKSAIMIAKK
jgi:hypothetical protein